MIRLLVILLVIVIVVLVLMMIRMRPSPPGSAKKRSPQQESPREILKRRYAAGEIDEDEYLRRMSGLSQDW
ncbi:SHOCT domain-containing protein [Nonomuraea dietziae]|uniref:SHOCT domain-containing protein n=1 Tax=Nonomuraea dietziae TaxID=65515 RepID=UPI0033EAD955